MKDNLREHLLRGVAWAAFEGTETNLCDLVWQGDFGKGIATGSGVFSEPGANPCVPYGPVPAAGISDNGVPFPSWKLGMIVGGDSGAEFVYCKLVLASATDLLPGQAYQIDENFTATLLTTSNSVLQGQVLIANIWAPQLAAGTYYVWLQRAGYCSVQAAALSIINAQAETTATAGQLKFLNTHTGGTKSTDGLTSFGASSSVQFTGTTTSGSPYITNVVSSNSLGGITDLQVGQVITGTNLPANSIIAAIDKYQGGWRITIGTNTAGSYNVLQNATGSASGTTFTVTSHVTANLYWPQLKTQN